MNEDDFPRMPPVQTFADLAALSAIMAPRPWRADGLTPRSDRPPHKGVDNRRARRKAQKIARRRNR